MMKQKKLPGTKEQSKYLGPFDVIEINDKHALCINDLGKNRKYPLHLIVKFYQRETLVGNIHYRENSKNTQVLLDYKHASLPCAA